MTGVRPDSIEFFCLPACRLCSWAGHRGVRLGFGNRSMLKFFKLGFARTRHSSGSPPCANLRLAFVSLGCLGQGSCVVQAAHGRVRSPTISRPRRTLTRPPQRMDILGELLRSCAVCGLSFRLSNSRAKPWITISRNERLSLSGRDVALLWRVPAKTTSLTVWSSRPRIVCLPCLSVRPFPPSMSAPTGRCSGRSGRSQRYGPNVFLSILLGILRYSALQTRKTFTARRTIMRR